MMRQLWTLLLLGTVLAVPACASRVKQTESSSPSVTYRYDDADDYDRVLARADAYCVEEYSRHAVLLDRDRDGNDYVATFRCE